MWGLVVVRIGWVFECDLLFLYGEGLVILVYCYWVVCSYFVRVCGVEGFCVFWFGVYYFVVVDCFGFGLFLFFLILFIEI